MTQKARSISCYKCGKYLGEIRDATLRKNIYHICEFCATPQPKAEPMDLFMGSVFGARK